MQASLLHRVQDLRLEKRPIPQPGPGEVLLRVKSVGIRGLNVHYYHDGQIWKDVIREPLTMGHEFSAQVAKLGEGVQGLEVGQLVAMEPAIVSGECEFCVLGLPRNRTLPAD